MLIETQPFDASEFLISPECQAELLADAYDSGDAAYVGHALDVIAKAKGIEGYPDDQNSRSLEHGTGK